MSGSKRSQGPDANGTETKKRFKSDHKGSKDGFKHKQGVTPNTNGLTTSKEAHAKQRELAKERRAAKPNADSIQRAKKLWERLRRKSHVPQDERRQLVSELFDIVSGNIKDFVFKHDSVRTIQCAIKYANKEQRKMIASELKGEYKTLAESKYAKFLVAKLLVAGDQEINETIISEFYGHVKRMINHPEASWILDDTYRQVATSRQKAILLREWYGPEFAIFKTAETDVPTADLSSILERNPEKQKPIMSHLHNMINQLVQKKMTAFTMLHDAMLQYSVAVGSPSASEQATEFIELLKGDEEGDLVRNLGFTKPGSRVMSRALALTGAKDRKLLLRPFKDYIVDMAHDPNGSIVLLAAFEVIDDTKLTSKSIISELLAAKAATEAERFDTITSLANHKIARIPLLYPFATDKVQRLTGKTTHATQVLEEVRILRSETSKKDAETRRKELVASLSQDGILLSTIEHRAAELTKTALGCQFITELILGVESGDRTPAMKAVARLASGDPKAQDHISKSTAAGKMLKTLVTGGRFDADKQEIVKIDPRLGFADLLYPEIKGYASAWALGDSSFVVANIMDDRGFQEKGDVIKRLRKHIPELQQVSGEGNKGASLLLVSM